MEKAIAPTPALLPGNSHGQRSLVGCSPWGRKQSDTTERLHFRDTRGFPGDSMVKNLPANPRATRDVGSLFGLGGAPGGGNGNPLQYSCLEKSMVRGAWQATVHVYSKSWT